jgi:hypothetical protein
MMRKLIYYIDKGFNQYEPFYEYTVLAVGEDEIYARQLCNYFIKDGMQYELLANELEEDDEILTIKEIGLNEKAPDEMDYRGKGLYVEIRLNSRSENYRLLTKLPCQTHFEVIRYLLKDAILLSELGQFRITSREIDEDRGVYVLYGEFNHGE